MSTKSKPKASTTKPAGDAASDETTPPLVGGDAPATGRTGDGPGEDGEAAAAAAVAGDDGGGDMQLPTVEQAGEFKLVHGKERGSTVAEVAERKGSDAYLKRLYGQSSAFPDQQDALEVWLTREAASDGDDAPGLTSADVDTARNPAARQVDPVAAAQAAVQREAHTRGVPIKGELPPGVPSPQEQQAAGVRPSQQRVPSDAELAAASVTGAPVTPAPQAPQGAPQGGHDAVILEGWGDYSVLFPDGTRRGKGAALRVYADDPLLDWKLPGGRTHSERFKLHPSPDQSSPCTVIANARMARKLAKLGYGRYQVKVGRHTAPMAAHARGESPLRQPRAEADMAEGDETTPALVTADEGTTEES